MPLAAKWDVIAWTIDAKKRVALLEHVNTPFYLKEDGRMYKVGSECMAGGGFDGSKMDRRWTVIDTGRGGENMGRGKRCDGSGSWYSQRKAGWDDSKDNMVMEQSLSTSYTISQTKHLIFNFLRAVSSAFLTNACAKS